MVMPESLYSGKARWGRVLRRRASSQVGEALSNSAPRLPVIFSFCMEKIAVNQMNKTSERKNEKNYRVVAFRGGGSMGRFRFN